MRLIVMLLSFVVTTQVWAGELPKPVGKVLLTLSGNIENTNEDGKAVFDIASLEKLGTVSFQTTSPWYNGRTTFTGISLQKLMDYVGAKGSVVKVTALNDYTTAIPLSDFKKYNVILALKINGEYMRIRDKGPLFIVYPYDSIPELNNQIFYSRSAWQVSSMKIE
ncbi:MULTISPECIES: molybdopterin-dependent oxidoreductase [unclassified Citrobacter]|uniref:molybdopterin-dependent oxidoreductase n=1 Tax=unclassified Citrobacter TaxID=2644389 RepID=UPI002303C981|nr:MULTISPECIES: molybdopterin-dependent oxidoreductase [unclassified Citrobacter]MDA8500239.1 molybdopterin-dependent oxidoreductase [Citrobacter sp. Igbk 17]MDA8504940.1 molybdopterin-dependent oxidoreductase [Citrobacter sp. Awk 2]MDA8514515.1 molybdopterin-dependent oxidoreductase [Citrobacter sp. Igbk 14]MDA8519068.1 molybdopterin-dependent oxidoreductase [Citrobacter sp. Igbk 16]MEB2416773.1 molybdopterin-dependent oxidoreductase [Citrobacter sp. R-1.5.2]